MERLNGQILISKVKEKYIEYEGHVEPINYKQFAPRDPELDKKFDEIFQFTLGQYKAVVKSSHKYLKRVAV